MCVCLSLCSVCCVRRVASTTWKKLLQPVLGRETQKKKNENDYAFVKKIELSLCGHHLIRTWWWRRADPKIWVVMKVPTNKKKTPVRPSVCAPFFFIFRKKTNSMTYCCYFAVAYWWRPSQPPPSPIDHTKENMRACGVETKIYILYKLREIILFWHDARERQST